MMLNSSYGNRVLVVVRDRESLLQGEGEQFTWYKTKMKGARCPMRDSDAVLYNIWKQTINENYKHDRLYRLLYNENLYTKAYINIYANKGSSTQGVDNETADGFSKEKINQLIESLKDESYQPLPSRRTYIPKKDGNKRPLGMPSFKDRLLQEVCRMIIEAIYEPIFSDKSHGFRPDRSCHTALKYIELDYRGVNWFIEGDRKGYFDNINHHVLIEILTEIEVRMNANKCEMCGIEGETIKYAVHRIKRLKDLKGKQDWEIKMISRNRKTMIVCESCHIAIHNNDINSLKR